MNLDCITVSDGSSKQCEGRVTTSAGRYRYCNTGRLLSTISVCVSVCGMNAWLGSSFS